MNKSIDESMHESMDESMDEAMDKITKWEADFHKQLLNPRRGVEGMANMCVYGQNLYTSSHARRERIFPRKKILESWDATSDAFMR